MYLSSFYILRYITFSPAFIMLVFKRLYYLVLGLAILSGVVLLQEFDILVYDTIGIDMVYDTI